MGGRRRSRQAWSARTTRAFHRPSRRTTTSLAFSALALASVIPVAVASTNVAVVVESLIDREIVGEGTPYRHRSTTDIFTGRLAGLSPAPGHGRDLLITGGLTAGSPEPVLVFHPSTPTPTGLPPALAPVAPGQEMTRQVTLDQDLAIMEAFAGSGEPRSVVIVTERPRTTAEPLGDVSEIPPTDDREYDDDFMLPDKDRVVIVSDPRSPWGLNAWLETVPWLKPIAEAAGIKTDGVRDPQATGKVKVVSVIIVGDPLSNFQWDPNRPIASMIVNIAGYLTITSGNGPHTYDDLARLGEPKLFTSHNTTYAVYEAAHPLALLLAVVYERLGIPYDKSDLERWNDKAQKFFPIQRPSVDTSAVPLDEGGSLPIDPANPGEPKEPENNPTPAPNQGIVPPTQPPASHDGEGTPPVIDQPVVDETPDEHHHDESDTHDDDAASDDGGSGTETTDSVDTERESDSPTEVSAANDERSETTTGGDTGRESTAGRPGTSSQTASAGGDSASDNS